MGAAGRENPVRYTETRAKSYSGLATPAPQQPAVDGAGGDCREHERARNSRLLPSRREAQMRHGQGLRRRRKWRTGNGFRPMPVLSQRQRASLRIDYGGSCFAGSRRPVRDAGFRTGNGPRADRCTAPHGGTSRVAKARTSHLNLELVNRVVAVVFTHSYLVFRGFLCVFYICSAV